VFFFFYFSGEDILRLRAVLPNNIFLVALISTSKRILLATFHLMLCSA